MKYIGSVLSIEITPKALDNNKMLSFYKVLKGIMNTKKKKRTMFHKIKTIITSIIINEGNIILRLSFCRNWEMN